MKLVVMRKDAKSNQRYNQHRSRMRGCVTFAPRLQHSIEVRDVTKSCTTLHTRMST